MRGCLDEGLTREVDKGECLTKCRFSGKTKPEVVFLQSLVEEEASYENGEQGSHLTTHASYSQGKGFYEKWPLRLKK